MRKRKILAFLLAFCLLNTTSCSAAESRQETPFAPSLSENTQKQGSTILIAYFSRVGNTDFPADVDAVSSASLLKKNEDLCGNTQYIAELIQQYTGGDLFLIQTEDKYPAIYDQVDQQGGEEHRSGIRPKLATHVENMDDYSIIFLGYPIWYYDMPMAVYSFLEEYDLSGKTIIPFVTSGASGFTGTLSTIQEIQPEANVETDGFDVKHSKVADVTAEDVKEWLDGVGLFTPFSDVSPNAEYAQAVAWCYEKGLMNGVEDGRFAPDGFMTRAMLATILYRQAGEPQVEGAPGFTDTLPDMWYSNAVVWAAGEKLLQGYGNGLFGVDDLVSREMLDVVAARQNGESPAWRGSAELAASATRAEAAVVFYETFALPGKSQAENGDGEPKPPQIEEDTAVGQFDLANKSVTLNSGYTMPINGLGTYSLTGDEGVNSVKAALESGVRLIDTAYMYHNEAEVGRAIRESGIPREEIFVITKLYPGSQYADPEQAIQDALDKLDIGYIDMMLLHHPGENDVKAYKAMEQAVADGKIRSIGLSNWYVEELEDFLPQVTITPALVQNEIHPYYQENDVIPYIQEKGIVVQGWYPLGGRGHTAELLGDETISAIAAAHGVSSAQVILRWNLQKGVVVIPGSSNPDHIKENTELYHFELTEDEMAQINALDRGEKHDWY